MKNEIILTHIPTGIIVKCSAYRSQHQNRDACWKRLKSLLYARQAGITASKEIVCTQMYLYSVQS